ncbi:hypothetical protein DFH07DRAFT_749557, partial [Mycena maculata]
AAPAASTKKENAILAQQIEILNWYYAQSKPSQKKTASHSAAIYLNLHIKQPFISDWLKNERMWWAQWDEAQVRGKARNMKCQKQVEHLEIEDMMELWIAKAMWDRLHLTSKIIRQKRTFFADLVEIPLDECLALSYGWLSVLKKGCGLKELKRYGEAGSADPVTIEEERLRVQKLILYEGYSLNDIFNMHLFWA